jgi:hypothetical protein
MGDFDSIQRISLGPAQFQLRTYMPRWTPIIKDGVGRVGTDFYMTGEGWIEAATPADFATAVQSVRDAFNVSGQPVVVYGLGSVELFRINPAECMEAGPHIGMELLDQSDDAGLMQRVKYTVNAKLMVKDAGGQTVAESYRVTQEKSPDDTLKVTYAGTLTGPSARGVFTGTTEPGFRLLYDPLDWVETIRFDASSNDTDIKYTISFEQLAEPLATGPLSGVEPGLIVDGVSSYRASRDDQQRKTENYSWDLLLATSDAQPIIDQIRNAKRGEDNKVLTPLSESVEISGLRQRRLRAEYTYLSSGSGDLLLEFEQTITVDDENNSLAALTYPGLDPVFYQGERQPRAASQTGRARSVGKFFKPPATFFDPKYLARPGKFSRRVLDGVQWEVSWEYQFVLPDTSKQPTEWAAALARPEQPKFGF